MPFAPTFIERTLFFGLDLAPQPILDILYAMSFQTAATAVKLGVFEVLRDGPKTAAEVAEAIGGDRRATRILLDALQSIGYVQIRGDRYANTRVATKWMVRDSERYIGAFFGHMQDMLDLWRHLDVSVREGRPPVMAWEFFQEDERRWQRFQDAMESAAKMSSPEIVSRVKLPSGARRMLDLGGGHGLHSVAFCKHYPELSAVVFDRPQARQAAERVFEERGVADRVSFSGGDFLADDIGSDFQVVLMFNVIHIHRRAQNVELLRKVHAAASPGGMVVIEDQTGFQRGTSVMSANASLEGLGLFNAVDGETYRTEEVQAMLKEAGFAKCRSFMLRDSPGYGITMATRA